MSEVCAGCQKEARVPMFWNERVYSTAMLSIDCGHVIGSCGICGNKYREECIALAFLFLLSYLCSLSVVVT